MRFLGNIHIYLRDEYFPAIYCVLHTPVVFATRGPTINEPHLGKPVFFLAIVALRNNCLQGHCRGQGRAAGEIKVGAAAEPG